MNTRIDATNTMIFITFRFVPQWVLLYNINIHFLISQVKKAQRFIEGFHIKYRILPGSDHHRTDQSYSGRIEYTIETVTGNAATMYVLRNLHRFTWYEIQVQPFYSSVEGPGSKVDRVRTFEDG